MYSKSKTTVTFFKNTPNPETGNMIENTDKVLYGRVSEAVKTGRKTEDGKDEYDFESWQARFVGKARAAAENLADKTKIVLTEWAVHPGYDKEKKRSYPYMMIMDFEVHKEK